MSYGPMLAPSDPWGGAQDLALAPGQPWVPIRGQTTPVMPMMAPPQCSYSMPSSGPLGYTGPGPSSPLASTRSTGHCPASPPGAVGLAAYPQSPPTACMLHHDILGSPPGYGNSRANWAFDAVPPMGMTQPGSEQGGSNGWAPVVRHTTFDESPPAHGSWASVVEPPKVGSFGGSPAPTVSNMAEHLSGGSRKDDGRSYPESFDYSGDPTWLRPPFGAQHQVSG